MDNQRHHRHRQYHYHTSLSSGTKRASPSSINIGTSSRRSNSSSSYGADGSYSRAHSQSTASRMSRKRGVSDELEDGEVRDPPAAVTPPPSAEPPFSISMDVRPATVPEAPPMNAVSPHGRNSTDSTAYNLRRSSRKRIQEELQPAAAAATPTPTACHRSQFHNTEVSTSRSKASSRNSSRSNSASSKRNASSRRSANTKRGTNSRSRKRRAASNSSHTDGDDSDPDYEYSTHRPGAATPYDSVHQEQKHTCFICSKVLSGDSNEINAHIDRCLSGTSDTNVGDATPADPGPMIEYEWGGQRRIRATAILEGGLRAAGLGYGSSATAGKDEDIDVDVDAEDEISFGASQYTDKDLIITSESAGSSSSQHNQHMPQYEETAPALDPEPSSPAAHAVARSEGASAVQTPSAIPASSSSSQLIIDALKERIRQQDRLLQAAHKCLVCLEPYVKPCTSINCWHVYCEKCWLQTLGTKKLCPQCNQITQPTDIRRVYL